MDPDQETNGVIEGAVPSFPRRPRAKPIHIPVEVKIDYESRATPKEPCGGEGGEGFSAWGVQMLK